ncbi:hypothetical protein GWK47_027393 [Chionoecetes opilio]|uniref:Uncharacterized protein n=1 Tax=Chionoecetes opilio TaxID=41210 RepID=A0A8J8WC69_CHIOP|nr:hypothetical protein GWK47_027393 [Chionoecetes opilio]
MRQACDMKRRKSEGDQYDWLVDYGFYLDQYKGDRVKTLGPADKKLYLLQEKDENDRKRANYHDQQSTSTQASVVSDDLGVEFSPGEAEIPYTGHPGGRHFWTSTADWATILASV